MSNNTFCTECANMEIHCGTMLCSRYNAVCYIYKMNHPGDCEGFTEKTEQHQAAEVTRYCRHCRHLTYGDHCARHLHPLDGSPLSCETARFDNRLCGMRGENFEYWDPENR